MIGLEPAERARGPEAEEGMDAGGLCSGAEERKRAERIRDEQDAPLRPPEGNLAPPAEPQDRAKLERRAGQLSRHDVVRDAESLRHGRAVAVVPVE